MYPKLSPKFARRGSGASIFSDERLDTKLLAYNPGLDYSIRPKERRFWECTKIHRHTVLLLAFICSIVLWSWTIISLLPATNNEIIQADMIIDEALVTIPTTPDQVYERPLILYTYHETENTRRNFEFFIQHGLHDGADFVFIINGPHTIGHLIPSAPHIGLIERHNTCFDLGAYDEVLKIENGRLKNYNKFILINASVRGPFLPKWSNQCWTDAYLDRITDKVKLVGIAMNCMDGQAPRARHVQSMVFATDRIGLDLMLSGNHLECAPTMVRTIDQEVGITATLLAHGYEVEAMMSAYGTEDFGKTCTQPDVLNGFNYYGTPIHPYETIFHKANRAIYPLQLELLTNWTDKAGYDSQKYCGRGTRKTILRN